jgi:adenylate cyclase
MPQQIVARLNEYFNVMAAEVTAQKGIVDKFIGDGMLDFFGVLESDDNPSLSGVRCALNMMERLDGLNETWQRRGEEPFKTGYAQ